MKLICTVLALWLASVTMALAAPAIAYLGEDGKAARFDPDGERLLVVHFWASWCPPCLEELPKLDEAAGRYAGRGLKVIALSLDTDPAKAKAFFAEHRIAHLKPWLDNGMASYRGFGAKGLPATVFLNAEGSELRREDGPLDWASPATKTFIEKTLGATR